MAGDVLSADADLDLGAVVAGLRESRDVLHNVRYRGPVRPPPSRAAIEEMLGQFARALFPPTTASSNAAIRQCRRRRR